MVDFLKEIDYAAPSKIAALYDYKMNDDNERLKIATEVAREHKAGLLDP